MAQYTDNIIVGAGPAGLQMAYFLQQRQQDYLIIEKSHQAGNFFVKFPCHRQLLSINKCYTGYTEREAQLRFDWNSLLGDDSVLNANDYSSEYFPKADIIVDYCNDYLKHYQLNAEFNQEIQHVSKNGDHFILTAAGGEQYHCQRLFIATGLFKENLPDIEGLELCKTYATASINPEDYKNKRVLIVGKGNSAFETADNLVATTQKIQMCGAKCVKLAWASHYVGDLRAVNNNFIDTYLLKSQNNILDGELRRVERQGDELIATIYFDSRKRDYAFPCDEVILCTGFKFDDTIFADNCRPELTPCGRLPLMTSAWQSTTAADLYFIGTIMQMRDRKKTMSGFIHGFRHNIKALDQILDETAEWSDHEVFAYDANTLTDKIIQRISRAAGIFLQPGFLCDLFWIDKSDQRIVYWHDVPKQYAIDQQMITDVFMVTLEYKVCDSLMNPLNMPRGVGVEEDFYLHPVIRQYEAGECVKRYFLADDLDNDWLLLPEHRERMCDIVESIFVRDIEIKNTEVV